MFSEKDIEKFSIRINLPKKEEPKDPVEQLLLSCPLSSLKPSEMSGLMVQLKSTINAIPIIMLSSDNAAISLSSKGLSLTIERGEKKESTSEKVEKRDLSQEILRKIGVDFNFLEAKLLGILNVDSLDANVKIDIREKTDKQLNYAKFLNQSFYDTYKQFKTIKVDGFSWKTEKELSGRKENLKISMWNTEKGISARILGKTEFRGPIDIVLFAQERIEVLNTFYNGMEA